MRKTVANRYERYGIAGVIARSRNMCNYPTITPGAAIRAHPAGRAIPLTVPWISQEKKHEPSMQDYLRPDKVEAMVQAARKAGRHPVRDAAIILMMFRHGLRTAELVALRWQQVDLKAGYLDVHRVKRGPQLRLLRELQRTYPDSPYVFVSERKSPLSPRSIREIVARTGKLAGLPFVPHPHQLRHACGYYLASRGHDTRAIQDYLRHRNIQHTMRYTAMPPHRFENFWQD